MNNQPTPETDNLARGNHVVPAEWAQKLERERDEARQLACLYRDQYWLCAQPNSVDMEPPRFSWEVAK